MPSATRFPPRSCAGTAAGASSGSSSACTWPPRPRIPGALVTYVNFPTTEYLQLPFLDLFCFNVYLESRERAGGLPGAAAEPGRREAAADGRDRPRQPPQRAGQAGREPRLAGAHGVRRRLRRRLRLRLDRRVASRRPRHRGLGFRPGDARPLAQARARGGPPGLQRSAVPRRHALADDQRRGLQLQRRAHHPRHDGRPEARGVSALRGHRRQ